MTPNAVVQMLKEGQKDLSWFNSNFAALLEQFNNKFIAFHHQAVIAAADTLDDLLHHLRKKNIDPSMVLIQFVSKVEQVL